MDIEKLVVVFDRAEDQGEDGEQEYRGEPKHPGNRSTGSESRTDDIDHRACQRMKEAQGEE